MSRRILYKFKLRIRFQCYGDFQIKKNNNMYMHSLYISTLINNMADCDSGPATLYIPS